MAHTQLCSRLVTRDPRLPFCSSIAAVHAEIPRFRCPDCHKPLITWTTVPILWVNNHLCGPTVLNPVCLDLSERLDLVHVFSALRYDWSLVRTEGLYKGV